MWALEILGGICRGRGRSSSRRRSNRPDFHFRCDGMTDCFRGGNVIQKFMLFYCILLVVGIPSFWLGCNYDVSDYCPAYDLRVYKVEDVYASRDPTNDYDYSAFVKFENVSCTLNAGDFGQKYKSTVLRRADHEYPIGKNVIVLEKKSNRKVCERVILKKLNWLVGITFLSLAACITGCFVVIAIGYSIAIVFQHIRAGLISRSSSFYGSCVTEGSFSARVIGFITGSSGFSWFYSRSANEDTEKKVDVEQGGVEIVTFATNKDDEPESKSDELVVSKYDSSNSKEHPRADINHGHFTNSGKGSGAVALQSNPLATMAAYKVGARIEANYNNGGKWLPARIELVSLDSSSYHVVYDSGETEYFVPKSRVRRVGSMRSSFSALDAVGASAPAAAAAEEDADDQKQTIEQGNEADVSSLLAINLLPGQIFDVLVVGEKSVGKTCFINRLVYDTFTSEKLTTTELKFTTKDVIADGGTMIQLRFWEVPVVAQLQTSKAALRLKDNVTVLLLFDVTNLETFEQIPQMKESLEKVTKAIGITIDQYLLLGTNLDATRFFPRGRLEDAEYATFCKNHNIREWFLLSAAEGDHVATVEQKIIHSLTHKRG